MSAIFRHIRRGSTAVIFAWIATMLPLPAFDLTLQDGKVYRDIRLLAKTDIGISIRHEDGVAAVDYTKMSTQDARMFGYDATRYDGAKAMEKMEAERSSKGKSEGKETAPAVDKPVDYGQCQGVTKKGSRCSRKATATGYCWQHH